MYTYKNISSYAPSEEKESHDHTKLVIYMNLISKTSLGLALLEAIQMSLPHASLAYINCQTSRPQLQYKENTRTPRGNN